MVFDVPSLIADCDGGWCVPFQNVAREGNDVAIKHGPVGVGEGGFLYDPKEYDVASHFFGDDEEIRPLLKRQG